MIGDTDLFIDLMHRRRPGHAPAVARIRELEGRGMRIGMAAITRLELASGAEQYVRPAEERERVLRVIRAFPAFPIDGPVADRAGSLLGSLRSRGVVLDIPDVLIAAVALAQHEPVLTRNRKDFERIPGVVVETY